MSCHPERGGYPSARRWPVHVKRDKSPAYAGFDNKKGFYPEGVEFRLGLDSTTFRVVEVVWIVDPG